MPKLHIDTDLGGDIDDLCAWPWLSIGPLLSCWP
jgi:hypothetical protein